jgi:Trypsin
MKKNILLPLIITLITCLSFADIEGGSEETLQENKQVLNSVLEIQMTGFLGGGSCTASLIKSNVLLTARHCVSDAFQRFYIQGERLNLPEISTSTTNDVALIKFQSNAKLDQILAQAQILPVSLTENKDLLTGEVLLAGYGITRRNADDSGVLRAGYNNVVEGTPGLKWLFESLIQAGGSKYVVAPQHLHILGVRETVYQNTFAMGQEVEVEDLFVSDNIPADQAIAYNGDSGGPLIGFGINNKPVIIGVTSTVSDVFYGTTITEMTLKDTETGMEKTVTLEKVINGDMAKNIKDFFAALLAEGFIQPKQTPEEKYTALKPFSYTYKMTRFNMNQYESTSFGTNAQFINETLAKFAQ